MQRRKIKFIETILIVILCFVQGVGISLAQENSGCGYSKAISEKEHQQSKIDAKEVAAFTDEFFNQYMEQYQIPGGAVLIVQDGKILFEKGYGYSDLEANKPFTTDQTYFSIASITKSFTAVAAMKLVQEGKLNLEEDILTYLPNLKIDNPYKNKITVKQLLTHTSGIDSSFTEDLSYDKTNNKEPHHLLNLLNKRGIKVISEPGKFVEYSSYGTVVLGAIVEEVSGMSCEEYIDQNILQPLEMEHTSILSPETKLTNGYLYSENGLTKAKLKGYFRLYPEGGLVSSVEDMAHYLEMLLAKGSYDNKKVLKCETVEEMLKRQASFNELLPGMCYGFAEYENEGIRSVGHAGYSIDGTLSDLVIYPEYNVGTFLVVNQGSNNNIQSDFRQAFIEKFLQQGNEDKTLEQTHLSKDQMQEDSTTNCETESTISTDKVEGTYRFSDYSRTNLYKVNTFGVGEVIIKAIDENTIHMSGSDEFTFEPYEKEAEKIGNLTYKVKDEESYIVFKEDETGKVSYMAESGSSSHGIYEKIKWYETAKWQVPFLEVVLCIYCIQLIVSLILFIVRKLKGNKIKDRLACKVNRIINSIAFLYVGFLIYGMYFWGDRLRYCVPIDVYVSLTMPIGSLILTIILAIMIVRKIYHVNTLSKKQFCGLIYEVGMLIISIGFVLLLNYWNFIGYKL